MATATKEKRVILSELRTARVPEEGEVLFHRNVAEADKRFRKEVLLADAGPKEAAAEDNAPMEVSVDGDFKGEIIYVDGKLWVLD
jgi:hypothetical protein